MAAVQEDATLSQCLAFCQALADKSLTFSFSLTIGTSFSFSVDTTGKGALAPQRKKRKVTPSTLRRNARRREEFLNKKLASAAQKASKSEEVSEEEACQKVPTSLQHHPSPAPSSERRQVITVGREKKRPTFSQLDGALPPSPATPSGTDLESRGPTEYCVFCPKERRHATIPHPYHLYSTVSCPVCLVKASEVGVCEDCHRGLDMNTGVWNQNHPHPKCKSCQ